MLALALAAAPAAQEPLGPLLLAGQDLIYRGRFSAAARYFTDLSLRYPREAAPHVLRASALIWDAEADGNELLHGDTVDAVLGEAIARGQVLVDSAPDDLARARALFWLGNAYGYRARQAELRGAAWRASRDARAMNQALERALALDSACADCLLPLGVYDYALARAGSVARLVARIIGMGGGDVTRGLERIRRAGELGTFSRWEARWVYASMLLRETDDPDAAARREEARRIIGDLAARFPENVVFRRALEAPVPGP